MYLDQFSSLYEQFLSFFPPSVHGVVSLALAVLLAYAIYKVIKRNFIFIILLILLLPQAGPILKSIWDNIVVIFKFLMSR